MKITASSLTTMSVLLGLPSGAAGEGMVFVTRALVPMAPASPLEAAVDKVHTMCEKDMMQFCGVFPLIAPPMDPVAALMDHMMNSALQDMLQHAVDSETPDVPTEEPPAPMETAEKALDGMVDKLAEHVASASADEDVPKERKDTVMEELVDQTAILDPSDLAQKIVARSLSIQKDEAEPAERRHLARRLSEIQPEIFLVRRAAQTPDRPRLGYGCRNSMCLWHHYEEKLVSQPCGEALNEAIREHNSANQQPGQRKVEELPMGIPSQPLRVIKTQEPDFHQEERCFFSLILICSFVSFAVYMILKKTFMKHHMRRGNPERRRLKRRILQAVYSDPELKASVEKSLGESIGTTPPIGPFLKTGPKDSPRGCVIVRIAIMSLLLITIMSNPLVAFPILSVLFVISIFRICHVREPGTMDLPTDGGCCDKDKCCPDEEENCCPEDCCPDEKDNCCPEDDNCCPDEERVEKKFVMHKGVPIQYV
eukprot:CAMPEP_0118687762 /NCGR_PEP_ID=MMETSP0800-20121206/8559_1 /TAXON_ID=210618 ORGANISM="Striatella unipunctata, Strain CCMP2910" /NCGR_SAMPLE_ID=MMETSP0800 /ASSEMBLY_ACC=CAM_ASM_000638 /LENGTH=480 /DNA_ID=CAMNT_0006584975 /DNA_START=27 /DNA_END=1469 /DNA_ORIENTATION=-